MNLGLTEYTHIYAALTSNDNQEATLVKPLILYPAVELPSTLPFAAKLGKLLGKTQALGQSVVQL